MWDTGNSLNKLITSINETEFLKDDNVIPVTAETNEFNELILTIGDTELHMDMDFNKMTSGTKIAW